MNYTVSDEGKVLSLLGNKKAEIYLEEENVLEVHFEKREDRKEFEGHFPKVSKRKK
jgi:hypothetical protein